jgi:hypothetical protein
LAIPTKSSDRVLTARIAAAAMHAQGKTNTGPARAALRDRYEQQVDPDGILSPDERAKRVAHARRADMLRLSLRSAQVRRKRST